MPPVGKNSDSGVTVDSVDTFSNKSIDADENNLSNIDNDEIKSNAAIDASKIANGSVSNTEFQYLNGLTDNIQDQLNNSGGGWHTKVLGSDFEVTSSTAFNEITGLTWLTMPDGVGNYAIRGRLLLDNNNTSATGIKFLLTGPSGGNTSITTVYVDGDNSTIHDKGWSSLDPFFAISGGFPLGDYLEIEGVVNGNNKVSIRVGQNSSNATPLVVRAGSWVEIKRVD